MVGLLWYWIKIRREERVAMELEKHCVISWQINISSLNYILVWKNILIHILFSVHIHFGMKRCLELASLNRIHSAISKELETAVGFCDLPALSLSRICNWFCVSQPQMELDELLPFQSLSRSSHFNSPPLWFLFLLALCWPILDYTNSSAFTKNGLKFTTRFFQSWSLVFLLSLSALTITGFF